MFIFADPADFCAPDGAGDGRQNGVDSDDCVSVWVRSRLAARS